MKKSKLFYLLFAVIGILLVVLMMNPRKPDPGIVVPEAPVAVSVMIAETSAIPDRIELTGRLEPDEEAMLATEKPGLVKKIHVDKGVRVKQGELLLELDQVLASNAVAKAQLALDEAERDLKRWKELSQSGAVAVTELDRLQTRRDLAGETLAEAKAWLDKCQVRSPGDGWIDERFLSEGEFAPEGEVAYRFVRIDPIKVRFDLPERDGKALKPGMSLPVRLNGELVFTGRVSFVSQAAARENNAFVVELTIPNPEGTLKPGLLATISVTRRQYDHAILMPLGSIVPHKDVHVAYVAEQGKAVRRIVKLAGLLGENAIVEEGLKPGDAVIVEGNRTLSDGTAVTVMSGGTSNP